MSWISLDFVEFGENYEMYSEFPYDIRHKYKLNILNGGLDKYGYKRICFTMNGRKKTYKVHRLLYYVLVKPFDINDRNIQIDHVNHNRDDNRPENLRLVSASENQFNVSKHKDIVYKFVKDLHDKIIVNELHKIYYSPSNDKFYRDIGPHFRELYERKRYKNCLEIHYVFEGKNNNLSTSKWRKDNGY